jgi:TRAP transporter 4TM/12TM fusion protein
MVLYHLISPFYLIIPSPVQHQNAHLFFALILVFLASAKSQQKMGLKLTLTLLSLLSLICTLFVHINYDRLLDVFFLNPPLADMIVGVSLILLCLEATRRAFGVAVPLVVSIFLIYALIGKYLPGFLQAPDIPIKGVLSRISIGSLGVYGIYSNILGMSANYIFLFIIFGAIIRVTGASRFFLQIGNLIGRTFAGGAAVTAVVTSALLGTLTGSTIANIATTGSFTIPMMKSVGYRPEQAAGIEATASLGGQILPPVMGAAAFLIMAFTGVPYLEVVKIALIPAILFFFSAFTYVLLQSMKARIGADTKKEVNYRDLFMSAPVFVFPLLFLITLLAIGYSLSYTISLAMLLVALLSTINKESRLDLRQWMATLRGGAIAGAQLGVTMAAIGILLGSLSMTVLVIKIPALVKMLAGGNLALALVFGAVASIILGCGVSTTATYALVSVTICPALTDMGLTMIQAHFFVLYYALIALVTPPVAVAAFVAARLAGSNFINTAFEASKVASGGFIIPFLMVWAPTILLQPVGEWYWIAMVIPACLIVILCVQVVLCGYYLGPIAYLGRGLFAIISVIVLFGFSTHNLTMLSTGAILFSFVTVIYWWREKKVKTTGVVDNGYSAEGHH